MGNKGHDGQSFKDYFDPTDKNLFHWEAKRGTTLNQPVIQELLDPPGNIYVFYRYDPQEPCWTFAGTATPVAHKDKKPVQITWRIQR
jgi:hypothetical protein